MTSLVETFLGSVLVSDFNSEKITGKQKKAGQN